MIELKLNPETFKELLKNGYNLDVIYLLKMIESGVEITEFCSNHKLQSLFQTIQRKQLAIDDKLTKEGTELIAFLSSPTEGVKLVKKKLKEDDFELFWKNFPSSDTFEYKGIKFPGSRALRTDKENCKTKLKAILNTGEYKIEEIVEAIKLDVLQKKEASIKSKINKLSYIQNSLTYLRQMSFEPFIELIKEGYKTKEVNTTSNETYI